MIRKEIKVKKIIPQINLIFKMTLDYSRLAETIQDFSLITLVSTATTLISTHSIGTQVQSNKRKTMNLDSSSTLKK